MPIISIINNKGGVAKTTTTFTLGTYLAKKGNKVLLIDLDPQMNLTEKVGAALDETVSYNIIDLLNAKPGAVFFSNEDGTLFTVKGNDKELDIFFNVTSDEEPEYSMKKNSLRKYGELLKNNFDYILIDCQPRMLNSDLLTSNEVALMASDYVIVPAVADKDSISGFQKVINTMKRIQPENPNLKLLGMVLTIVVGRNEKIFRHYKEKLKLQLGDLLFDTDIRRSTEMSQALNSNVSIFDYNEKNATAEDYTNFSEEVLSKISKFENNG